MFKLGRKTKETLLAFFGLVAAAGYLDATAYEDFDGKDGGNFLCDIDPTCRNLTEGEIELATELFGDSIDTSNIKVFDRQNIFLSLLFAIDPSPPPASSPNGAIYISDADWRDDDYSDEDSPIHHFAHELTHVWQDQQGMNIVGTALSEFFRSGDYQALYDYELDELVSFDELNFEQQAEIVEDYVFKMIELRSMSDNLVSVWFDANCDDFTTIENALSGSLSIVQEEGCQADEAPKPESKNYAFRM